MITNLQKELIAIEVISTLRSLFEKFPVGNDSCGNFPFHEPFLNALSRKIEGEHASIPVSWIFDLDASSELSFIEKIAHILSGGEKRKFTTKGRNALRISRSQKEIINRIIYDLTKGTRQPNLLQEDSECLSSQNFETDATDFSVDVFFQDDEQVVCIDLKTVSPNKSLSNFDKEKVLEAKIALKNIYPNKTVRYFLGFPFDPLSNTPTGYDKQRYMDYSVGFRKYFSENEFLLASELWDFLSGESRTMEVILEIINSIATVDFVDKYNYLKKNDNRLHKNEYIKRLRDWFLFREIKLIQNFETLLRRISGKKQLTTILNQTFDNHFNEKRYYTLNELIL